MAVVNEQSVLSFYLQEMEKDTISFLKGREGLKEKIRENIKQLSVAVHMNDKIEVSKRLWKLLFEAAMTYIDPDKRGYDELFQFFDEYVEFEELIFASDSFYRDHTFHCLWVYFLGEYITKTEEFMFLFSRYNTELEYVKIIKKTLEQLGLQLDNYYYAMNELLKLEKYQDSIYCVAALTHDLGYPLKKVGKINKSIGKILPYFTINNFNEFHFKFDNIQKNNIDSFIDMLSDNLYISIEDKTHEFEQLLTKVLHVENDQVIGINEEAFNELSSLEIEQLKQLGYKLDIRVQLKTERSEYISYCNDFEEYQHGIMSAFLLTRVLKTFTNSKMFYASKSNINFNDIDYADVFAKKAILSAITNHTNASYRISEITSNSSLLTLVDELEEFSRISRANQNRQYVQEFCKTELYIEDGVFNIDFIFDNEELDNLDPERAFKGRCKRFLTLFHISKLSDEIKLRLRCISRLSYDHNTYTLEIRRKFAKITINDMEKNIPEYLKGRQFYTREEYAELD